MENPFYNLKPISDPDMFIGRTYLLSRVFSDITHNQCISLVGSPRIGKSSILMQIRSPQSQQKYHYIESHLALAYVDFQSLRQKTCEYFFTQVSANLITASGKSLKPRYTTKDGEERFVHTLEWLQEQGYHPVLLMDNFDDLVKNKRFDSDFFAFLRSQATIDKISYVTASLARLSKLPPLYEQESSGFFNIFALRKIEPLTLDEARTLIITTSRVGGCPFTEEEADRVVKLSGRHPFFIQRVCFFLFEEKSLHDTILPNWNDIQRQVYDDLFPLFKQIWESFLNVEQQELLKEMAQQENTQQQDLAELSESVLFRQFVRDMCQSTSLHSISKEKELEVVKEEIEIKELTEVLKKVLKHIDDAEFLGKSKLTQYQLVTVRSGVGHITTIEKGRIVREVLNEAFERLKGPGNRSDSAYEWKLYNILYYRYYKEHRTTRYIYTRLHISKRKYFYDHHEAFEKLANILKEMEDMSDTKNSDSL